jgi:hypothetical protein
VSTDVSEGWTVLVAFGLWIAVTFVALLRAIGRTPDE